MIRWVIVLSAIVATVGALILWWWFVRCETDCAAADRAAEDLFERGELLSVLELIDTVDSKCHCSRFTSGDAPTQYALAQECVRQLRGKGMTTELERLLMHSRSPILMEVANR